MLVHSSPIKSRERSVHGTLHTSATYAGRVHDVKEYRLPETKWQHPWLCFHNFETAIFNKLVHKSSPRFRIFNKLVHKSSPCFHNFETAILNKLVHKSSPCFHKFQAAIFNKLIHKPSLCFHKFQTAIFNKLVHKFYFKKSKKRVCLFSIL